MGNRETFTYPYIPRMMLSAWTDRKGTVGFIGKDGRSVGRKSADEVCTETFIVDGDIPSDIDTFSNRRISEILESIMKGEMPKGMEALGTVALLILGMYFKTPSGFGVTRNGNEDVRNLSDLVRYDGEMKRMLPDLLRFRYFTADTPDYFEFVLGDNPLCILNMMRKGEEKTLLSPGVILLLPVTPHRAVILSDDSCYWIHAGSGRFVLSSDDVYAVNRYIMKNSRETVSVWSRFNSYDGGERLLSSRKLAKETEDVDFSLSFFSPRPGVAGEKGRYE